MDAEHLILGAGCAGLALAAALVDAGVREQILLVDRRTSFENDRTWCFWDTGDIPWAHLATRRWEAWNVRTESPHPTSAARGGSRTRTCRPTSTPRRSSPGSRARRT